VPDPPFGTILSPRRPHDPDFGCHKSTGIDLSGLAATGQRLRRDGLGYRSATTRSIPGFQSAPRRARLTGQGGGVAEGRAGTGDMPIRPCWGPLSDGVLGKFCTPWPAF